MKFNMLCFGEPYTLTSPHSPPYISIFNQKSYLINLLKLFFGQFLQELEKLDADEIMAKHVEQLEAEKKELQARLKSQEKKVGCFS